MIALDLKPGAKKLRQFSFIALFGFGLVGCALYWGWGFFSVSHTAAYVLWALALLTPLLGLVAPRAVLPIYVVLTLVTFPIGLVVSTVVLCLLYFGLFTPLALFFRIVGRDALDRKLDPEASTYWKEVGQPRPAADYLRQF